MVQNDWVPISKKVSGKCVVASLAVKHIQVIQSVFVVLHIVVVKTFLLA